MLNMQTPGLTGSPLDRADHLREDGEAVSELRRRDDARLLLLNGLEPCHDDNGTLQWSTLADAPAEGDLALLGFLDGSPRFVALAEAPSGYTRSAALIRSLELMPPEQGATFAAARSLVDWHNRHRYCAQCGTMTRIARAGWARNCPNCNAQHFPRTDPVVIMLAEYEDRVLVGRQPNFPAGRYSALAGFIEVGESIEEAVRRELKEEAGITASRVRYVASQPWPFPSSLMIACIAQAENDTITLDTNELEHAMWCDRTAVAAALAASADAPFLTPPPYAIAHTLFTRWVNEG